MKKILLALLIVFCFALPAQAAHIYVEEDPGNPGQIMYDSNGWPSDNPGTRTENSDIEAAVTAAGVSGIIELSGSTAGVTYSTTELDAADGIDISIALSEFKGSSAGDHNGTVTLDGTGLSDQIISCTTNMIGAISNIIFTNSQTGYHCIRCTTDITISDCIFTNTQRGINVYDASIIVNRCLFHTCNYFAIAHGGTGDNDSSTFNYCQITNSGDDAGFQRAVDISRGITITFNNCVFVDNPKQAIFTSTGNQNINLNNCILSGNVEFKQDFHIINHTGGGTFTTTNCVLLPHPDEAKSNTRGFLNVTDGGNNVFGSPGFIANRRPAYLGIIIDDYANLSHWTDLADACAARGFHCTFALNTNGVSAADWTTLQTYVDAGHEVAAHSRHHAWLNNMNALNVQYTGGAATCTMTIDVGSNSITTSTTGSVDDLTIDISNTSYDDIGEIIAYINGQANYTASTASPSGQSNAALCTSLADITAQDIKTAQYTCLFDQTRYYTDEIVGAKTDIEANLSGYTCRSFVFPYNGNDEASEDAVKNAGYLGARVGNTNMSYTLASLEIYRIRGLTMATYMGTTDDTGGAFTIMNIPARAAAYVERMGYEGAATIFFAHAAVEYSLANWIIILDAIKQTNANVMTLGDMIELIRAEGSTVDNETWTRSFTDESNYHLSPFSGCINAGTDVSLTQDFEKQRVPRSSTPEIGIYEYWPKPFNLKIEDYKNRPFMRENSKSTKLWQIVGN